MAYFGKDLEGRSRALFTHENEILVIVTAMVLKNNHTGSMV